MTAPIPFDRDSILTRRALMQAHHATASWWVGVPREDWPAAVQREQGRMSLTLFGRLERRSIVAADDPALRGRRLPIGEGA